MPYLTPDELNSARVCRVLFIPDNVQWLEIVNGALNTLMIERNFELFGDVTPQQCVEVFTDMFIDYLNERPCMLGSILPYATTAAPSGTLPCDGSTYDRVDYPNLYAALDSAYIIDADTFKTPDLRGRTVIGSGTGDDLTARGVGDEGGEETHVLTVAELAVHDHTSTPHTHTYDHPIINIDVEGAGIPDPVAVGQPFFPATTSAATVDISSTGEDEPHNNMQPYHVLRYCIIAR